MVQTSRTRKQLFSNVWQSLAGQRLAYPERGTVGHEKVKKRTQSYEGGWLGPGGHQLAKGVDQLMMLSPQL